MESFLPADHAPRTQLSDICECPDDEYTAEEVDQDFVESFPSKEAHGAAQELAQAFHLWNLGSDLVGSDHELQEVDIEPTIRLAFDLEQSDDGLEAMGRKRAPGMGDEVTALPINNGTRGLVITIGYLG
ncbi:hypothetical protein AAF712_003964 [Marasmius tenuissimus]|uniref:Uncharacterized protein n=1 Tax=Marasmius tenuissimus TaxID=585030 RepID=A0ABR3A6K8_9AGAR